MKIGIFDSGLGGMFTLDKCKQALPQNEFIGYFDRVNAPYGDLSPVEIYELTRLGLSNLFDQNCDLVLIACNTAASQALRRLQDQLPNRKILGCLIPAIETAIDAGGQRIGVIATQHTVNTKKYQREAFKINPRTKVFPLATPKLVPWIETEQQKSQACQAYLKQQVQTLIDDYQIDSLILGCTHYSAIKSNVEALFPQINIIDSAEAQAEKLIDYLYRHPELQQ